MRIAMLAPFAIFGPKGTARWRVLPLARALAAAGHQVRVVVPPYDRPQQGGRRWLDRGVEVVNLPVPQAAPALSHGALAVRVARAALAWRPAVIHCFKPKGPAGLAAWLLKALHPDLPLVVDADDWETGWNRLAAYPAPWRALFRRQERWGLARADAVTAASRWLYVHAGDQRGCLDQVVYLPNGVEADRGGTGQVPARAAGRSVLLYTRFVEHSPRDVWEVWRHVQAAEPAARLLVAGRGLQGEEARLARLGAHGTLRILGWLPPPARAGLFAAVDLALFPVDDTPLNRAKSPMRLLDVQAAGLPVATQAVGEYGLIVRHGETGLVVPSGDPRALAGAVLKLLGDGDLRLRLGQAAAARTAERYAWSRLAQAAVRAYALAGAVP